MRDWWVTPPPPPDARDIGRITCRSGFRPASYVRRACRQAEPMGRNAVLDCRRFRFGCRPGQRARDHPTFGQCE